MGSFEFRDIHPRLFIGTCSDRYAGWIGQIYSEGRYSDRITYREKTIGRQSFTEEVLPVESVEEFFTHFPVLEIDFTFYRTLLTEEGMPTQNHHVLEKYKNHLKSTDLVIVKVPQAVFAPRIRKGSEFVENKHYLDADLFIRSFYQPAGDILGENLAGFIFEQAYQRKEDRPSVSDMAGDLDRFFKTLPRDDRYHVEIRTAGLLKDPVLDALDKHGIGLILSHWTWLPSLEEQYSLWKERGGFSNKSLLLRLVTPRNKTYAQTYQAAHPFNRLVEGMLREDMIEDTVEIIRGVVVQGKRIYLLINNRAGGNAPLIAERIAERFQS